MHSALLIIEKPTSAEPAKRAAWQKLLRELKELAEQDKTIEMLAESVFLIPLTGGGGMYTLTALLGLADPRQFAHRVLFFAQPPDWVRSGAAAHH